MKRRVAAGIFFLIFSSAAFSISQDVPPKRAFFPLTAKVARQIQNHFHIPAETLPAGLYYSDPRTSRFRLDGGPALNGKSLSISVEDLSTDKQILFLYGNSGWEAHRPKKMAAGKEDLSFNEFIWSVGWVPTITKENSRVNQLWVISPQDEKWLLLEDDLSGRSEGLISHFFTELPNYFLPVANGAVVLRSDWLLNYIPIGEEAKTSFTKVDFDDRETPNTVFKVAFHRGLTYFAQPWDLPLIYYQPDRGLLLFAQRQVIKGTEMAHLPLREKDLTDLFVLNPANGRVEQLVESVAYTPFALDEAGLFFPSPDPLRPDLYLQNFNWEKRSFAREGLPVDLDSKFRPDYDHDLFYAATRLIDGKRDFVTFNSVGSAVPYRRISTAGPSKDDLYLLENSGRPQDLLEELRLGQHYSFMTLNAYDRELNAALSREQDTLLVFTFEADEEPINLFFGYLYSLDTKLWPVPRPLRYLKHAFLLQPPHFNKLAAIEGATSGKNTLLYIADYPAARLEGNDEALKAAALRFESLKKTFGECSRLGTCRVVVNVPRPIWAALRRKHPAAIAGLNSVRLPNPETYEERREFVTALMHRMVLTAKLTITEPTLRAAFALVEDRRKEDLERGGNAMSFYKRIIKEIIKEAEKDSLASRPNKEISIAQVEHFLNRQNQHFTLAEVNSKIDGNVVPAWRDKTGNLREIFPANSAYRWQWKNEGNRLVWEARYGHALYHSTSGGREAEALVMLLPEGGPQTILKGKTICHAQLHPDGTYVVYSESNQLKLFFFEINQKFPAVANSKPGSVRLLASDLSLKDYESHRMRFQYRAGNLEIVTPDETRVFNPFGDLEVLDVP